MNMQEIQESLIKHGMHECYVEKESISLMRDVRSVPHYATLRKEKLDDLIIMAIKVRSDMFIQNQIAQERKRELRSIHLKRKTYIFEVEYKKG